MRHLPLYAGPPVLPVEREPSLDRDAVLAEDPHCGRCELGERPKVRACLPAEGEPGGLLVVGEAPGSEENDVGRPFVGKSGQKLRLILAKYWKGPVAIANALGCFPPRDGVKEKHVNACRGFLAATLREVRPTRVVAVGGWAAYSLTGRAPPTLSVRRGYAYLGEAPSVPVFFTIHPAAALRNRFVAKWWQEDLEWALTCQPPPPPPLGARVALVEDEASALAAEAHLREAALDGRWVAFDCETMGWMHTPDFRVASLAMVAQGEEDAFAWTKAALDGPAAAPLRRLLADPAVKKCGHNAKYDTLAIASDPRLVVEVRGLEVDTLLLRKLQFSEADGELKVLSELVGMGGHKDEAEAVVADACRRLHRKNSRPPEGAPAEDWDAAWAAVQLGDEPKKYAYGLMPFEVLHRYCALDAVATARLGAKLEGELAAQPDQWREWGALVRPSAEAAVQMERWGIHCDQVATRRFSAHLEARLGELAGAFAAYEGFNPASTRAVGELLFKKLGLPVVKFTETGNPSTDEEALEAIKHAHPVVPAIMEHRRLGKLYGTYAKGLLGHVRPDGRIHPSYHVHGTRTGRFSSSDPNLYNVPRPTSSEGKMARNCYAAPEGFLLLELDQSQIELRVAAMLSSDPKMRQIYLDGVDYHLRTARMVSQAAWGVPPERVTKDSEYRAIAKVINFAMMYGQGDEAMAAQAKCSLKQAAAFRRAIMGEFSVLAKWIAERVAESRRTGEAWTWWAGERARCRSLYQIGDQDEERRVRAEHGAFNGPIQGTAAYFTTASVVELVRWIRRERLEGDVKLVLSVYDSILFEVREHMATDVARKARAVMTGWPSMGVPLVADAKIGPAWGSLEEYEFEDPAAAEGKG